MDKDKEFAAWWEAKKRSTFAQIISESGEQRAKIIAREAWYGALSAQPDQAVIAVPSTAELLRALLARGGPAGALAEAGLLALRKGEDYGTDAARDIYFPFGLPSYVQMLHVKTQRLLSLAALPREQHFEGVRDTVVDLINYGSFTADWLAREKAKVAS